MKWLHTIRQLLKRENAGAVEGKHDPLSDALEWLKADVKSLESYLEQPKGEEHLLRLYYFYMKNHVDIAILEYSLHQDIIKSLEQFHTAAVSGYCYQMVSARGAGWEMSDTDYEPVCHAMLSGNQATLDLFLSDAYPVHDVEKNHISAWVYRCIQHSLRGENEDLEHLVQVFRRNKWYSGNKPFSPYADFFNAIVCRDATKCTDALHLLLATLHKREESETYPQLFAVIITALAKLAIDKGVIAEFTSAQVPAAFFSCDRLEAYPDCSLLTDKL